LSTWVKASEAPLTEEEQMRKRRFKIDPTFENKIPSLAPAFLWLMYTYYPIYAHEGIRDLPEIVRLSTEEYWKENDLYIQFTNDKIESAPADSMLSLQEIYEVFKTWYIQSYGSVNIPSRPYFLSMIKVTWGIPPSAEGYWYGVKIKEDNSNLKSNNMAAGSEKQMVTADDILQKNLQKYDDGNLSQFYSTNIVV
jgi:phage/plasmid-associated DNA primase